MSEFLSEERRKELETLSVKLGVRFRNLALLDRALTHTSYANEAKRKTDHNERLEFLGDAVLELASSTYLYGHFKQLPEGELTKIRASIVRSETLARLARDLQLGEHRQRGIAYGLLRISKRFLDGLCCFETDDRRTQIDHRLDCLGPCRSGQARFLCRRRRQGPVLFDEIVSTHKHSEV